jgi:hypothetical protein
VAEIHAVKTYKHHFPTVSSFCCRLSKESNNKRKYKQSRANKMSNNHQQSYSKGTIALPRIHLSISFSSLNLTLSLVVRLTDACISFRVPVDWRGIAKAEKEREINCLLQDSNPGSVGYPTGYRILIP